jgi:hypothetical protein
VCGPQQVLILWSSNKAISNELVGTAVTLCTNSSFTRPATVSTQPLNRNEYRVASRGWTSMLAWRHRHLWTDVAISLAYGHRRPYLYRARPIIPIALGSYWSATSAYEKWISCAPVSVVSYIRPAKYPPSAIVTLGALLPSVWRAGCLWPETSKQVYLVWQYFVLKIVTWFDVLEFGFRHALWF